MPPKIDPPAMRDNFVTRANMSFGEFVTAATLLVSSAAMSVDIFLPALPVIGNAYGISDENHRQFVILIFALGLALGQLFFGPMSDYYGRRPFLIGGLALMATMGALAPFSPDFSMLLAARFIQGLGASAVRASLIATIRDCFKGNEMGRIMSIVFSAFMIVPIAAPFAGQGLILVSGWRTIFYFVAVISALLAFWVSLRMGETLSPENRRKITPSNFANALRQIVTNRIAVGYTICATLTYGALFAYISLSQQIYGELYGLGSWFPAAFAGTAIGMAVGNIFSARLVRSLGMRKIAHAALLLFTISGIVLAVWSYLQTPPLAIAFILIGFVMIGFGVIQGNVSALALEPLGHIAGTASSIFGVVTTTIAVILGGLAGQAYDGTLRSFSITIALGGVLSVIAVLWTEHGKLFGRSEHS